MVDRRRCLALVPLALFAAGCGSAEPTPIFAAASPRPSTESVPMMEAAAPSGAPFVAADGRDLKACGDGECEVLVRTGDQIPNDGGAGPLSVTIQAGKAGLAPASGGMGEAVSGPPGMVHQINRQVIVVVAVRDGDGIIRLSKK
ncbi:hypothetical protein [Amycolatopsis sp. BJA-103]|uniref:hypothetical protein n=1 Tax=unclassified Amycolatopsis TaxID=2618356 RepID=UPI000C78AEAC|nr:hypothetical protein [Amycolatopsis sp. BJA-103]AUI58957.1 hypothetical protein BKN51_12540 [Amycolatopsis sp. BJA-103]PNE17593.1 hypothetical protein B1H26_22025 [Amycolatopsis sp. BJA-103]